MIIDLSVPLNNKTPVYPGDTRIKILSEDSIAADGYLGHSVTLGTHNGTHIDAPAHMIEGAVTLGLIPVETFVGMGRLVEGFSIEALETAGVGAGDIVLFYTGASQRFDEESYFTDYPAMSLEVADWLVTKGVKLVGMDTCSADNVEGFPVHKKLLGANIPIIETMTNLEVLGGRHFELFALPLKLDLDGSPARVIAVVQDA